MNHVEQRLHSVVGFNPYQLEHALTALRVARPLHWAGVQYVRGNEAAGVHPERVSLGEVVLVQRDFSGYLAMYEQILEWARAEGKPIVYEVDDLLWELPDDHPDVAIDYYTPASFAMLRTLVEADLVTTTTPALRAYLQPYNPNVCLLPNYLDDGLWKLRSSKTSPEGAPVVIGYMGTTSHIPDLERMVPLYQRLLARYGDRIRLRFWGVQPPVEIRDHPQVEWLPISMNDYHEFAAYFSTQESDIFLAPLQDTFFNRCKSPLKYLEYSALGVPGIYSRITPYEALVEHGANGYLAGEMEEWETHLVRLIEDPHLRLRMGERALQTVKEHWLLSQHANEWVEAYERAQAIRRDPQLQQNRSEYTRAFIRVAQRVWAWQQKKDLRIQELQAQVAERDQRLERMTRHPVYSAMSKTRLVVKRLVGRR